MTASPRYPNELDDLRGKVNPRLPWEPPPEGSWKTFFVPRGDGWQRPAAREWASSTARWLGLEARLLEANGPWAPVQVRVPDGAEAHVAGILCSHPVVVDGEGDLPPEQVSGDGFLGPVAPSELHSRSEPTGPDGTSRAGAPERLDGFVPQPGPDDGTREQPELSGGKVPGLDGYPLLPSPCEVTARPFDRSCFIPGTANCDWEPSTAGFQGWDPGDDEVVIRVEDEEWWSSTDDRYRNAQLQQIIDDVAADSSLRLVFPADSTFRVIEPIRLRGNVTVEGQGETTRFAVGEYTEAAGREDTKADGDHRTAFLVDGYPDKADLQDFYGEESGDHKVIDLFVEPDFRDADGLMRSTVRNVRVQNLAIVSELRSDFYRTDSPFYDPSPPAERDARIGIALWLAQNVLIDRVWFLGSYQRGSGPLYRGVWARGAQDTTVSGCRFMRLFRNAAVGSGVDNIPTGWTPTCVLGLSREEREVLVGTPFVPTVYQQTRSLRFCGNHIRECGWGNQWASGGTGATYNSLDFNGEELVFAGNTFLFDAQCMKVPDSRYVLIARNLFLWSGYRSARDSWGTAGYAIRINEGVAVHDAGEDFSGADISARTPGWVRIRGNLFYHQRGPAIQVWETLGLPVQIENNSYYWNYLSRFPRYDFEEEPPNPGPTDGWQVDLLMAYNVSFCDGDEWIVEDERVDLHEGDPTSSNADLVAAVDNYFSLVQRPLERGSDPSITTPLCVPSWAGYDPRDAAALKEYREQEWIHWVNMNRTWSWCAAKAHVGECEEMAVVWVPRSDDSEWVIPFAGVDADEDEEAEIPTVIRIIDARLAAGVLQCPWS